MTLRQILLALRARFRLFLVVLLATVVATAAVTFMLPRTYKATVSLLLDSPDQQSLANQQAAFTFNQPQERQSYLQTQMDIMTSHQVARRAVDELKLAVNPEWRTAFAEDTRGQEGVAIEDWIADELLKQFKVGTTQSNMLQATVSSGDRHFAARVVNAFAKAYMDTMVELRTAPTREASAWFDEQLKSLRTRLETAQAQLTEYVRRQNVNAGDERYDVDTARLGALTDQAMRAREQASLWSAREQQGRKFVDGGGAADRLPDVVDNALVQRLKGELATGEAKLQELSTQYGSNYPAVQRQESQNRALRERIGAESQKVVAGVQNSARQSREREAALTSALEAQRAKMLSQRGNRDEANVLRRNVESAERAYDLALQKAAVAEVESRARKTNVALLAPAVAPRLPSTPRVKLNLALSLLIGTMLGLALVMLLEMADRRVRTRDDLLLSPDIPLLGVLNARGLSNTLLLPAPVMTHRALPGRR